MTWIGPNDGASPRTCHCSPCDAPADPRCSVCGGDGIELTEDPISREFLCETCAPTEDESCEEYLDRVRKIRRTKT